LSKTKRKGFAKKTTEYDQNYKTLHFYKSGFVSRRVADPDRGSGIRCLFDPWIRDPGWAKHQDPDPGSETGMNNPDHISESLETIFWVKILKFFYADPESGMEKIQIRDQKNSDPGSGINIPDPHHWFLKWS
jgi:hypothetical protein